VDHPRIHVDLGAMQAEDFPGRIAVSPTVIVAPSRISSYSSLRFSLAQRRSRSYCSSVMI
jgi:hypothetical protein